MRNFLGWLTSQNDVISIFIVFAFIFFVLMAGSWLRVKIEKFWSPDRPGIESGWGVENNSFKQNLYLWLWLTIFFSLFLLFIEVFGV